MRRPTLWWMGAAVLATAGAGCGDKGLAGEDGEPGSAGGDALVEVSEEQSGESCEHGGTRAAYGLDGNGNGTLDPDEVDGVEYACDGAPGDEGANGPDGEEGTVGQAALLVASDEVAGENCEHGGKRLDHGVDADGDGSLSDEEITATRYVCSGREGSGGTDALQALVSLSEEAPGANCGSGGQKLEHGSDTDADGMLDADEVEGESYVCNGSGGSAGLFGLMQVSEEAAGANCADGGVRVDSGLDADGDETLDAAEVQATRYVCDGAAAPDGLVGLVSVSSEPTGSNCAAGGQRIQTGMDADASGGLDAGEVVQTSYVCNGVGGQDGTDGDDGTTSLLSISDEAPGGNCAGGGKHIQAGSDADGDGTLAAGEITQQDYVCHGVDGVDGSDGNDGTWSLVLVGDEGPGSNCADGGKQIDVGEDANGNGTLDPGELAQTEYVCDGAAGADGAGGSDGVALLVETGEESPGGNCAAGGVFVRFGADSDADGALAGPEVEGTRYICDGADGADGAEGSDGDNGLAGLVSFSEEAPGGNCAAGGERIDYGMDADADGTLDTAEIAGTRYVCDGAAGTDGSDGADGSDGSTTLVSVSEEAAGANCSMGGQRIDVGVDDDDDDTLDSGEIESTSYVCNG